MKALITKKVVVRREENLVDSDTGAVMTTEWIGMKSKEVTYYLLFIPIYHDKQVFGKG
ncbi:hypothetical protein [uncultured Bacteroides sp.]|uniref:hypothetical protein n=1 Tax=uncultured Bacteroides sp. TaxID=162156 RepID=UPI0025EF8E30|nr:hypothetical protein [uncultured Bacteroides sp.]